MSKKSNLIKLRKAWKLAPPGAKEKCYNETFNFNRQTANALVRNGGKDETVLRLLYAIKQTSKDVLKDIAKANDKIQKI